MTEQESYMIFDLQYGSTGKGLLAGYLAATREPDTIVTAWGPNAGHTYVGANGRRFVHRMLGNGVVSPKLKNVLIGPGSVIDPAILLTEIIECADLLEGKTICIHPNAAIVNESHQVTERANVKIGSTMKGTGAAVIQRIERNPYNMNTAKSTRLEGWLRRQLHNNLGSYDKHDINIAVGKQSYDFLLDAGDLIQIEGAQGYDLSIYGRFYPYCTSRDVTPAQVCADCAIPFDWCPQVYGTLRTFPIRVANRFDKEGKQIGTSGPCYADQAELTWDEIGQSPEFTTVTGLKRRVFSFSFQQLKEAVRQCAPDVLFLNFCNYKEDGQVDLLLDSIAEEVDPLVRWLGHGPTHNDITELF